MLNLKKQSGLPAHFANNAVIFGKGVVFEPVRIRSLDDARPYLMDKNATSRRKNLYLMYRDPHLAYDEALFRKHGIRYDITVLFPGTIGGKNGEYIKTIGHTHPAAEIYEVLRGQALFILQRTEEQGDLYYISATKGEKVIIPSGYGHITVNIGSEPLILADLFSDTVKADYSFFRKRHGAAYWVCAPEFTKDGLILSENKGHKNIGAMHMGVPASLDAIGLPAKSPLYTLFISDPKRFSFLTDPKKESVLTKKTPLFDISWSGKLAPTPNERREA